MLGVRVRSPIRGRRRVYQPRNRGPAPAGARNAKSNRPTWLPGGRTRRPGADGCRRWYKPGSRSHPPSQSRAPRCAAPSPRARSTLSRASPLPAATKLRARAVFARHGIAKGVERGRGGRVDFRADIRAGNRVDLLAENPPGGQPLDIMAIETNETAGGELRRGAQRAGAERGRRASDAAEIAFDRLEAFGQRHGSRKARALDAEAGLSGYPARILELVCDEAVSAG